MTTNDTGPARGRRHAVTALLCTTAGILPAALFAGMAPLIRAELGFSAAWIGIGVAIFFATSALVSVHAGRLVERTGSQRALWLGVGLSATALLGIGTLAHNRAVLFAFLAIGGLSNAVTQPAANLALARGVGVERRGLAFGFKQAAIPAAAALGGFSLPAIGVTLGWRPAFLGASLLALLCATLPTTIKPPEAREDDARPRLLSPIPRSLWLLTGGIALGSAAANAMASYLVESSIAAGWSPAQAGVFLGVGSTMGIVARVTVGWITDRLRSGWLRVVAVMMLVGSVGFGSLAFLDIPVLLAVGVSLGFVAGWGYNGLFLYAVVRLHPEAPAAATGVTQVGAFGGPVIGPPLFGLIAATWSYELAWLTMGLFSALAAGLVQLARRSVRSSG